MVFIQNSSVGNEILWQQPGGSFKSVPSALQIVQFGETTYTWTGMFYPTHFSPMSDFVSFAESFLQCIVNIRQIV